MCEYALKNDCQAQTCWRRAGFLLSRYTFQWHVKFICKWITCWQVQRAARSLGFREHGGVLFGGLWSHRGCRVLGLCYTWYPFCWKGCSPHVHIDPHPTRLGETWQYKSDKHIHRLRVGGYLSADATVIKHTQTKMKGGYFYYELHYFTSQLLCCDMAVLLV